MEVQTAGKASTGLGTRGVLVFSTLRPHGWPLGEDGMFCWIKRSARAPTFNTDCRFLSSNIGVGIAPGVDVIGP